MRDIKAPLPSQICNAEEAASSVIGLMDKRHLLSNKNFVQQLIGGDPITVDLLLGRRVYIELDEDATISLGSFIATAFEQSVYLYINPVTYTVTWGDSITWDGGAPSLSASSLNIVRLWTINNWGTIYGELLASNLSAPTMSVHPDTYAGWSIASHLENIVQFNVVTETTQLVFENAFPDEIDYYRPRNGSAAMNPVSGIAFILGGYSSNNVTDRYGFIYGYVVNSVSVWGAVAPFRVRDACSHALTDWDNGFSDAFMLGNNGNESSGVSNTFNQIKLFVGAFVNNTAYINKSYTMLLSGETYGFLMGSNPRTTSYARYSYSAGTITNYSSYIGSYAGYVYAGACHDPDTEIGYILGGDDVSSDRAVLKFNTASQAISLVSTTALPTVTTFTRGYAQSKDYAWLYRTSDSSKFTISTETAASMTNGSYPTSAGPIIPSNNMVI